MAIRAATAVDTEVKITRLIARVRATASLYRKHILATVAIQHVTLVDMQNALSAPALLIPSSGKELNQMPRGASHWLRAWLLLCRSRCSHCLLLLASLLLATAHTDVIIAVYIFTAEVPNR